MREWLAQNYTWVFSGVGVTVVMFFLGLLRRRWKTDAESRPSAVVSSVGRDSIASPIAGRDVHQIFLSRVVPTKTEEENEEFSQHPTAAEIIERIKILPLMQRPKFGREYCGLKVKWQGRITSIGRSKTPGAVEIYLFTGSGRSGSTGAFVVGKVILEKYPRLNTVHDDERATIWGTITGADEAGIEVDVERLRFEPS